MAKIDIEAFMKREFGTRGGKLLAQLLDYIGADNLKYASDDQKEKFVAELVPEFRQKSLSRSTFLTTEVMSIIGLEKKTLVGVEVKKIDKNVVQDYINTHGKDKIKGAFAKIEAIFNLFWSKAYEAFESGVSVDDIHRITDNVLQELKNDLFSICDEIEDMFNIRGGKGLNMIKTKLEKKGKYEEFSFDDGGSNLFSERRKNEMILEDLFKEFKSDVNKSYSSFENLFMKTVDQEISLRQKNLNDEGLKEETKAETRAILSKIRMAYEALREKVEKMNPDAEPNEMKTDIST